MVEIVGQVCHQLRLEAGLEAVVLSGRVFMNALLLGETIVRLSRDWVYRHERVAPSDGGLSLGQRAVAAVPGG